MAQSQKKCLLCAIHRILMNSATDADRKRIIDASKKPPTHNFTYDFRRSCPHRGGFGCKINREYNHVRNSHVMSVLCCEFNNEFKCYTVFVEQNSIYYEVDDDGEYHNDDFKVDNDYYDHDEDDYKDENEYENCVEDDDSDSDYCDIAYHSSDDDEDKERDSDLE